jgi:RNA polymerase sigma-70 factor (ECF subfamily)
MGPDWRSSEERRNAFDATASPWMKMVYNRALRLTSNPDAAGDLLQETYLRAFRTFDNFREGTNARAWLLTILYSVFVSSWRRQKREPDAVPLEEAEQSSADLTPPAVALESRMWASEEVHAALEQVPPTLRAVLLMVDVDDMTYEEVAAAMGSPIGTVRSRLSRARHILSAALEDYARTHGYQKGPS